MILRACELELLFARKGEDIVPQHVLFAVVLMITSAFGVMNKVVFHHDPRATLIIVESPSAVFVGSDVVDVIAGNHGALGRAQRVDRSHIAQQTVANVMDVIVDDAVAFCRTRLVAPAPADGDAGVGHETNVIVGNHVVTAVTDPDAYGAGEILAAVMDDIVIERLMGTCQCARLREFHRARAQTASTQVMKTTRAHRVMVALLAKPDAVDARVSDFAFLQGDSFAKVCLDDRFH